MKFHLDHTPKKSNFLIDHKSTVLLIGSCFAENIGALLSDFKFKSLVNPNGILFNPISVYNCLNVAIHNKKTDENLLLERDGLFYSYLHHTSFSSQTKKDLVQHLNSVTQHMHQFLKTTNVLIITFGTAFTYWHKQLSHTVANCHKQPATIFDKKLLEVEEIVKTYSTLINDLKTLNPDLKIIFTVSPVKYLKDGIEENNLSKSTLVLGIHKLISVNTNCFYFPAFELVNDDLRDYRFYKEDLAHPNKTAIDYVWKKFSNCYFDSKTLELNHHIEKLNLALNHRQMHENTLETEKLREFIDRQRTLIKKMDSSIEI